MHRDAPCHRWGTRYRLQRNDPPQCHDAGPSRTRQDSSASASTQCVPVSPLPEISRFFGIVVGMLYSEHGVPHLHAAYGEFVISVEIDSFQEFAARLRRGRRRWSLNGRGRIDKIC